MTLDDIEVIENTSGLYTQEEYYCALQRAINEGQWGLQGSYGRAMMRAINEGCCLLGPRESRDYWGSHIPSRDQVKEGTKGSYDFVVSRMGEDWAALMNGV